MRRNAQSAVAVDADAAGRRSSVGLVGGPWGDEGWTDSEGEKYFRFLREDGFTWGWRCGQPF